MNGLVGWLAGWLVGCWLVDCLVVFPPPVHINVFWLRLNGAVRGQGSQSASILLAPPRSVDFDINPMGARSSAPAHAQLSAVARSSAPDWRARARVTSVQRARARLPGVV